MSAIEQAIEVIQILLQMEERPKIIASANSAIKALQAAQATPPAAVPEHINVRPTGPLIPDPVWWAPKILKAAKADTPPAAQSQEQQK